MGNERTPAGDRMIPPELVAEAKAHPGGWVYEIEGEFERDEGVPPEAIRGAWAVNTDGEIVGEFIPNPKFRSAHQFGTS